MVVKFNCPYFTKYIMSVKFNSIAVGSLNTRNLQNVCIAKLINDSSSDFKKPDPQTPVIKKFGPLQNLVEFL